MTVSTEVTRVIVEGDGVTTAFTYSFPIPGSSGTDQTNADLWITDTNSISTNLADNLWSITGVVSILPIDGSASGTFTYNPGSPITTGNFLTLERIVPYEQGTTLSAQGAYSPQVVEAALDNLALQTEQLNTWRLQSVRAPITDAALSDLPTAGKRANSFLYFDGNGDVTTASSTGGMPTSILVGTDSTHAGATVTLLMTGTAVTSVVDVNGTTTATIDTAAAAGSFVFLQAHTASNSATLDFTSFISATYDTYMFQLVSIVPASNDVTMEMRFGTGAGPTWDAGNNYRWVISSASNAVMTVTNSASASSMNLAADVQNNDPLDGTVTVYDPANTTAVHGITQLVYNPNGVPMASITGAVRYIAGVAVTGVRFLTSSGNITSGVIRVYGMTKS